MWPTRRSPTPPRPWPDPVQAGGLTCTVTLRTSISRVSSRTRLMARDSKRTRAAQAAPSTITTRRSPLRLAPRTCGETSGGSADWTHRASRSVAAALRTIPDNPPVSARRSLSSLGFSGGMSVKLRSKPLSRVGILGILCSTEKGKATERWRRKASGLRVDAYDSGVAIVKEERTVPFPCSQGGCWGVLPRRQFVAEARVRREDGSPPAHAGSSS